MKPYPKYKDSGVEWIGEVPKGWSISKLKWLSQVYSGTNMKNEIGTYPLYGANGIIGKCITAIFDKEKVIIGRVGSSGEINFASGLYGVSDNALVIDNGKDITSKFLYYFLTTIDFSTDITLNAQPLLTATNVKNKLITIPDIKEQQFIITYLDRKTAQIDNLISKKQKLIELLKEERAAIINQAVTKGLNPDAPMKDSGIEWLGEVPEHWEKTKIKFCTEFINGYAFKSDDYIAGEGIPIIRIGDIKNEVDLNKTQKVPEEYAAIFKTFAVKKNDILVALTGATIGKSAVYNSAEPALLNQRVGILRPTDKIHLNFLRFFIDSNIFKQLIEYECVGGAQENIGKEEIGSCVLYLPKLQDQIQISLFFDSKTTKIDQTISKIEKQIDLLKEFRAALISEAVTGKIDVRNEGSNG